MRGAMAQRVEAMVDWAAAALFSAAVGFSLAKLLSPVGGVAGALAALWLCKAILGRIDGDRLQFAVPTFALGSVEASGGHVDELDLTDADRLYPRPSQEDAALLLDDVLPAIGPDSRVVRLFDPSATPTPGRLRTGIEQQFDVGPSHSPSADASQALYDALADLRRSLR